MELYNKMRNNVKVQAKMRIESPLKKLREEKGLSQAELAVKIGVSPSTVNRWENIERGTEPSMTIAEWWRCCKALGLDWDELPIYFLSALEYAA